MYISLYIYAKTVTKFRGKFPVLAWLEALLASPKSFGLHFRGSKKAPVVPINSQQKNTRFLAESSKVPALCHSLLMVEAWHASHGVVKKHRMNSIFEHQNWWNIRNYEIRILNLFHGPIIERSRLAKLFFGVWSMAFPAQCQTIEARDTWRIGSRDFDCLRRWKAQRRALLPGTLEAMEFPIFAPFLLEESTLKPSFCRLNLNTKQSHLAVSLTQQKALQLPQP